MIFWTWEARSQLCWVLSHSNFCLFSESECHLMLVRSCIGNMHAEIPRCISILDCNENETMQQNRILFFFVCMNYCSDESVRGIVARFFSADFCLFSWFFFVQLKRDSGRIFQCKCMERTSILPFSFLVGNHACMHSRFWKQLAFGCFITLHGQLN